MTTEREIKETVRERYAESARQVKGSRDASCCGCGPTEDVISSKLYTTDQLQGLPQEAVVASLGCANPVAMAELHEGEVVLDLGSGGGIDVLLSARRVGPSGKAYGLDMTDEMLELARENQRKAGATNVEFLKGEMEDMPLPDGSVDVIISNCVVNLSPDKDKVLAEAHRVLKPGGRVAIADIVVRGGRVPPTLRRDLELWAGCVAGALEESEYRTKLEAAGFTDIDIEPVREYTAADAEGAGLGDVLRKYGTKGAERLGFLSAIVRARKPDGVAQAATAESGIQTTLSDKEKESVVIGAAHSSSWDLRTASGARRSQ